MDIKEDSKGGTPSPTRQASSKSSDVKCISDGCKEGDIGSNRSSSAATSSAGSGEQVVVKEQVKAVVDDLENVLGELKTVVGDLRVLVNQIDVVTSKIDEEYGAELLDKRRRSASLLETGSPRRHLPGLVRHSLSQPFELLRPHADWVFQIHGDVTPILNTSHDIATGMSGSGGEAPSNELNNAQPLVSVEKDKSGDEKAATCLTNHTASTRAPASPRKDDIVICSPGGLCPKRETTRAGAAASNCSNTASNSPLRTSTSPNVTGSRRKAESQAIYENFPMRVGPLPLLPPPPPSQPLGSTRVGNNTSRASQRTSMGSQAQSPRTSNSSSGIGNSNESGNGNTCNGSRQHGRHRKSGRGLAGRRAEMVDNTTQVDLHRPPMPFQYCDNRPSLAADGNPSRQQEDHFSSHPHAPLQDHRAKAGLLPVGGDSGCLGDDLKGPLLHVHHAQCSPCSPSPDSEYCGVYERELELKLELFFDEEELDNSPRTLDLQTYPDYGSTFDRERVSRWAAYTLVNLGTLPTSSSDQFTETPSEASSDILNDNVFVSEADEAVMPDCAAEVPWASVFDKYYNQSLGGLETG